jgi:hypothetical protein
MNVLCACVADRAQAPVPSQSESERDPAGQANQGSGSEIDEDRKGAKTAKTVEAEHPHVQNFEESSIN